MSNYSFSPLILTHNIVYYRHDLTRPQMLAISCGFDLLHSCRKIPQQFTIRLEAPSKICEELHSPVTQQPLLGLFHTNAQLPSIQRPLAMLRYHHHQNTFSLSRISRIAHLCSNESHSSPAPARLRFHAGIPSVFSPSIPTLTIARSCGEMIPGGEMIPPG